jgi:biotin-[acetyl-CoA-carboxylase] ligase BirA-like protein
MREAAVLVTAQYQSSGRGRNGRTWQGDHGANVYASFGIRHSHEQNAAELSSWMGRGALAVLAVLRTFLPTQRLRLKYPNDVQAFDEGWKKISGILVEHEFLGSQCTSSIIGIGINVEQLVFSDTIAQPCTSMQRLGASCTVQMVVDLLRQHMSMLADQPWNKSFALWVEELAVLGRVVRLNDTQDEWIVQEILSDGRMIVRSITDTNERVVTDGDSIRYTD